MSTANNKTLSQAFLRAYSKGERPGTTIPAPHAFSAHDRPRAAERQTSPTRQPQAALAPEVSDHPVAATTAAQPANPIPAPHVNFPAVYAVSTDQFQFPSALLVSQIDAAAVVHDAPEIAPPAFSQPLSIPAPAPARPSIHTAPPQEQAELHTSTKPRSDAFEYVSKPFASSAAVPTAPKMAPPPVAPAPTFFENIAREPAFLPAWEVDQFGWTDEGQQLFQTLAGAFDDAGEQLRTVTEEGLHVLAVSSTYRGEGRTIVATLLARAAARAGVSVALIDADVENPQIAAHLKVQLSSDWLSTLNNSIPLEEAAIASLDENIVAYPLRPEAREKMVLLNHAEFVRFLERVAATVQLVIVDLGPYTHDQRRMFPVGPNCPINAAIVVRDLRTTSEQQAKSVAQSLRNMGVEAVGIAENFTR